MRECGDEAGDEVVNGGNFVLFGGRRGDRRGGFDEGCLKSMNELEEREEEYAGRGFLRRGLLDSLYR